MSICFCKNEYAILDSSNLYNIQTWYETHKNRKINKLFNKISGMYKQIKVIKEVTLYFSGKLSC